METFWFFWLRFRRAYDSAYDSDFWFSPGHKRSYDSAYDSDSDSVASENQFLSPGLTRTGVKLSPYLIAKECKNATHCSRGDGCVKSAHKVDSL